MLTMMKSINYLFLALLAFVVDAVAFATVALLLPRFVLILREPGGLGALLVIGAFLLFVAGVFVARRMKPTPSGREEVLSRPWRVGLALLFALVGSLAMARQMGFFASGPVVDTTQIGEGGSMSYFVFGPGAWLALSLLYVLVLAFNVTPAIENTGVGYGAAALFGLATADAMLTVFVAQGRVILAEIGAGWVWILPAFVLLLLMFGPPRLLYVSRTLGLREPMAYGVIAVFLLLLGICATVMVIRVF
jgi:hypothetical protein